MSMPFTCPLCRQPITVAESDIGRTGPCPHCGQTIQITAPASGMGYTSAAAAGGGGGVMKILLLVFGILAAVMLLIVGGLALLLWPAISQARAAGRDAMSRNHMRQISVAMIIYEENHRYYPRAAMISQEDEQALRQMGPENAAPKPLLSWRVELLPYIEYQNLYDQFHHDEPWDSPHNMALIPMMPEIYRSPNSKLAENEYKTNYLVVTGPETAFRLDRRCDSSDIYDGTSRTIAVVEVNDDAAVVWTKPDDLDVGPGSNPLEHIGELSPRGTNVVYFDGSIQKLPEDITAEQFRGLCTIRGEEMDDIDDYY